MSPRLVGTPWRCLWLWQLCLHRRQLRRQSQLPPPSRRNYADDVNPQQQSSASSPPKTTASDWVHEWCKKWILTGVWRLKVNTCKLKISLTVIDINIRRMLPKDRFKTLLSDRFKWRTDFRSRRVKHSRERYGFLFARNLLPRWWVHFCIALEKIISMIIWHFKTL